MATIPKKWYNAKLQTLNRVVKTSRLALMKRSQYVNRTENRTHIAGSETVAWTDDEELRDVKQYGFGENFSVRQINTRTRDVLSLCIEAASASSTRWTG